MLLISLDRTPDRARRLALEELEAGNPIIAPSDTCYGFLADATREEGIDQIVALKHRPRRGKAFLMMVADIAMAERYVEISPKARALMEQHLPGALTLILPKRADVELFGAVRDTVGIRIPDQPFCLDLVRELDRPLITTSANLSGNPPAYTVEAVLEQIPILADAPILSIDGGVLAETLPSTIVRMLGDEPELLRSGPVRIPGLETVSAHPGVPAH